MKQNHRTFEGLISILFSRITLGKKDCGELLFDLISPIFMEYRGIAHECCFTEIDVPIDLRWVSQGISGLL